MTIMTLEKLDNPFYTGLVEISIYHHLVGASGTKSAPREKP